VAPNNTRYLVYVDNDDSAIKVHGPLSLSQAEGFIAGAQWVNASEVEYLGDYPDLWSAIDSYRLDPALQAIYPDYEVVKLKFAPSDLDAATGTSYLLYYDSDSGLLKIRGPLSVPQAQGFLAGTEWVNDSALEYDSDYVRLEDARAGAQAYSQAHGEDFEIEEFPVDISPLAPPAPEI
jgi:hypothetical protein